MRLIEETKTISQEQRRCQKLMIELSNELKRDPQVNRKKIMELSNIGRLLINLNISNWAIDDKSSLYIDGI